MQLKHRVVEANINMREKTCSGPVTMSPGASAPGCTSRRSWAGGTSAASADLRGYVSTPRTTALHCRGCAPPSYLFAKHKATPGAPYLFGNVFSIFPKDSAPNQDLAGKEAGRVSGAAAGANGPNDASLAHREWPGHGGRGRGPAAALTCRTPAPA